VSPVPEREEYYFLTSGGHQRRNAARDAGLKKLPVFVGATPAEQKQLGLRLARENTAQVNRSPVNLGFLYSQLIEEFGMTQEEIAAEIKKDRYHVNFAIMAARSATDIRAALREKYSPRVMTYLRRLEHKEDRAPIIARYLANDLTVEGVRVAVEKAREEKKQAVSRSATSIPVEEQAQHSEIHDEPLAKKQGKQEDLLQGVKDVLRSSGSGSDEGVLKGSGGSVDASERVSKAQAAFSRIETYRRYIEKKRADGENILLSKQEATLLGRIIDRCHTLLDTYGDNQA
jgi:ParB/RepB/Spo0J family partition protein